MTARTYPSLPANQGANLTYQYDLMGRLSGLSVNGTSQATAAYGPASELTNLTYFGYSETRTYNSLLQLTRQTVAGVFDTEYIFPGGANNGQISASIDHISGQQVNYTYDLLKRLTAASTTDGTVGRGLHLRRVRQSELRDGDARQRSELGECIGPGDEPADRRALRCQWQQPHRNRPLLLDKL